MAMSNSILLEVITPERRIFSAQVSELQFPTAYGGIYGILPEHTPLMTPLGDGLVHYVQGGEKHVLTVFGGFAEVGPEAVTLLARESETTDMIDPDKIEADRQSALKLMKDAVSETERSAAKVLLDASTIRLSAVGR